MKGLAIWCDGGSQGNPVIDIHINYWKLPSRGSNFNRFLDFGINIHNAKIFNTLYFYLPFGLSDDKLFDLGKVITRGSPDLLNAIFNECYKITSAASSYHEVKDSNGGGVVFNIFEMSPSNFSIAKRHNGTIISITLPPLAIREDKTYIRFRILDKNIICFSSIEKNVASVLSNAFTRTEIFDFRINSKRHLPTTLLEEMVQYCTVNINKIHLFYICSYRENYILSHKPFSKARKIEDGIWDDYISSSNPKNNPLLDTLVAYHWREFAKDSDFVDEFDVLLKTTYLHNNWETIIKYLGYLIIFAMATGIIANLISNGIYNYFWSENKSYYENAVNQSSNNKTQPNIVTQDVESLIQNKD